MKIGAFTILVPFLATPALAEGVAWRHDFEKARQEAEIQTLPLYVEFSADG